MSTMALRFIRGGLFTNDVGCSSDGCVDRDRVAKLAPPTLLSASPVSVRLLELPHGPGAAEMGAHRPTPVRMWPKRRPTGFGRKARKAALGSERSAAVRDQTSRSSTDDGN
jgi:hypothetical protein